MKKISLFCALLIFCLINLSAQEVRGVETRTVCVYDCPEGEVQGDGWSQSVYIHDRDQSDTHRYKSCYHSTSYGCYYHIYPGLAYCFTNLNSTTVSVDAELYHKGQLTDTKSFVLKSKEEYTWKTNKYGFDSRDRDDYMVKYKAFKVQ